MTARFRSWYLDGCDNILSGWCLVYRMAPLVVSVVVAFGLGVVLWSMAGVAGTTLALANMGVTATLYLWFVWWVTR